MAPGNHTLDGIHGCLAVVVMLNHAAHLRGWSSLTWPANVSVEVFFMLSACVLTRSWDGRYLTFLARRALRLWPTYGLCLLAGALVFRQAVPLPYYAWFPLSTPDMALYVSIALVFAAAHLLTGTVEAWSIAASRAVPRRLAGWIAGRESLPARSRMPA